MHTQICNEEMPPPSLYASKFPPQNMQFPDDHIHAMFQSLRLSNYADDFQSLNETKVWKTQPQVDAPRSIRPRERRDSTSYPCLASTTQASTCASNTSLPCIVHLCHAIRVLLYCITVSTVLQFAEKRNPKDNFAMFFWIVHPCAGKTAMGWVCWQQTKWFDPRKTYHYRFKMIR